MKQIISSMPFCSQHIPKKFRKLTLCLWEKCDLNLSSRLCWLVTLLYTTRSWICEQVKGIQWKKKERKQVQDCRNAVLIYTACKTTNSTQKWRCAQTHTLSLLRTQRAQQEPAITLSEIWGWKNKSLWNVASLLKVKKEQSKSSQVRYFFPL